MDSDPWSAKVTFFMVFFFFFLIIVCFYFHLLFLSIYNVVLVSPI